MDRCQCLTIKGVQCSNTASNKDGQNPLYCWQHQKCKKGIPSSLQRVEPSSLQRVEPSSLQRVEPSSLQRVEPSSLQRVEPSSLQRVEPVKTNMPVKKTNMPVKKTKVPVKKTKVPVKKTKVPVGQTNKKIIPLRFDNHKYPFEFTSKWPLATLGSGGYAYVYAYKLMTGKTVAIKAPHEEYEYEHGLSLVTLKEITALQMLRGCNNILQLLNIDHQINLERHITKVRLMMPLHATDLEMFSGFHPFSEKLKYANDIITQLLDGLFQLYSRGILHRDIKPANIFIDNEYDEETNKLLDIPQCYYGDFGVSEKLPCNVEQRHEHLMTKGYTAVYTAPELLVGNDDYTDKIDMWSLGVTLAEYFIADKEIRLFSSTKFDNSFPDVYSILPNLTDHSPSRNQYKQYEELIKNNELHDNINVGKFLSTHLPLAEYQQIPSNIIKLITSMLAINPNDRPHITELVTNVSVCPYPPTLLSRGELYLGTETNLKDYFNLIDWLLNVSNESQLPIRNTIACFDMVDRYLANFDVKEPDLELLGVTLLFTIGKIINKKPPTIYEIVDITKGKYTADQIRIKELEVITQLNYTLLSCEIDNYVDKLRNITNVSKRYDRLHQAYVKMSKKGLYPGSLSYDDIIGYLG